MYSNGLVSVPKAGLSLFGSSLTVASGGLTVVAGGLTLVGGLRTLAGAVSVSSSSTTIGVDVYQSAAGPLTAPSIQGRVPAGVTAAKLLQLWEGSNSLFQVLLKIALCYASLSHGHFPL